MVLSDRLIRERIERGELRVDPLRPDAVRENGLDLRIGREVAFPVVRGEVIDIENHAEPHFSVREIPDEGVVIPGNTSVLLVTEEVVGLPGDLVGLCGLRSTLARWGFVAPPTVVDAGFEGQLTIEVAWTRPVPVRIYPGIRFLHLVLFEVPGGVERPYSGSYQGQRGVTLPRPAGRGSAGAGGV